MRLDAKVFCSILTLFREKHKLDICFHMPAHICADDHAGGVHHQQQDAEGPPLRLGELSCLLYFQHMGLGVCKRLCTLVSTSSKANIIMGIPCIIPRKCCRNSHLKSNTAKHRNVIHARALTFMTHTNAEMNFVMQVTAALEGSINKLKGVKSKGGDSPHGTADSSDHGSDSD